MSGFSPVKGKIDNVDIVRRHGETSVIDSRSHDDPSSWRLYCRLKRGDGADFDGCGRHRWLRPLELVKDCRQRPELILSSSLLWSGVDTLPRIREDHLLS
jgi:hypothetical protein